MELFVLDNLGNFVGAATAHFEQVADIVSLETMALREGLILA